MTSLAVCLAPLPGFGRGWGGMLKKPGEAKHTAPKWGVRVGGWAREWRLEVKEEEEGWMLFPTLILPVCRDHMCVNQALEHPFCLFCLFWSVPLTSLSPPSLAFPLSLSIVLIFKSFYDSVALIKSSFCSQAHIKTFRPGTNFPASGNMLWILIITLSQMMMVMMMMGVFYILGSSVSLIANQVDINDVLLF